LSNLLTAFSSSEKTEFLWGVIDTGSVWRRSDLVGEGLIPSR